jgi:hypothetical protein
VSRSPALFAVLACGVGFACGEVVTRGARTPLAPAGSARDDGSGFLARLSSRPSFGGPKEGRAAATTYGGRTYGQQAASYGGTLYANYRFEYTAIDPLPPQPYRPGYAAVAVPTSGTIEGSVVWPGAPSAADRIPTGRTGCPVDVPNQTLVLGGGNAVANAVVYLEDITRGRQMLGRGAYTPRVHQVGGALEWRGCRLRPHLQIAAPIGSVLSVMSADDELTLAGVVVAGTHRDPLFTLRLARPGASREVQLARDGFVEIRPEPSASGSGWVIVAPHPYMVASDERGRFSLEEVPPGTYTLVVWHEPVVTGVTVKGELVTTAATVVKRRVTVKAGQTQRMTVRLPSTR